MEYGINGEIVMSMIKHVASEVTGIAVKDISESTEIMGKDLEKIKRILKRTSEAKIEFPEVDSMTVEEIFSVVYQRGLFN